MPNFSNKSHIFSTHLWKRVILLFLALGLLPVACSKGKSGSKSSGGELDKLEQRAKKTSNYRKVLVQLQAYLKRVENPQKRKRAEELQSSVQSKLGKAESDEFQKMSQQVDQCIKEGKLDQALGILKTPSVILRHSKYLEKIVERVKQLQSQKALYNYGLSLVTKARQYMSRKDFETALSILDAFNAIEGDKPTTIVNKISDLRKEIEDKSSNPGSGGSSNAVMSVDDTWLQILPEGTDLNGAEAMHLRPDATREWSLAGGVLKGKGTREGRNLTTLWISELPGSSGAEEGIDLKQVKEFMCVFEFKIEQGQGFDFVIRLVEEPTRAKTYFILSASKFKTNTWYRVQGGIKAGQASLACPTTRFSEKNPTPNSGGQMGFSIYKNTVVSIRNFRIKVITKQ